jgi:hypothetical protein
MAKSLIPGLEAKTALILITVIPTAIVLSIAMAIIHFFRKARRNNLIQQQQQKDLETRAEARLTQAIRPEPTLPDIRVFGEVQEQPAQSRRIEGNLAARRDRLAPPPIHTGSPPVRLCQNKNTHRLEKQRSHEDRMRDVATTRPVDIMGVNEPVQVYDSASQRTIYYG